MGNSSGTTKSMERTKCEVFSRIVGYMRPISQWNDANQARWKDIKFFKLNKMYEKSTSSPDS